jgi:opacity protein-like surface antigen
MVMATCLGHIPRQSCNKGVIIICPHKDKYLHGRKHRASLDPRNQYKTTSVVFLLTTRIAQYIIVQAIKLNRFFQKGNFQMKKLIAMALILAAGAASALEVGVTGTRDYAGVDRNGGGITIGGKAGSVGVTAGFERFTSGANDQDRYSVVAGYDVAKFGPVTVTPKIGAAYLNNQTGADGYALTVGAGVSVPVAQKVSLGLDYARQYGQSRVDSFNGNRVTVSARYAF